MNLSGPVLHFVSPLKWLDVQDLCISVIAKPPFSYTRQRFSF